MAKFRKISEFSLAQGEPDVGAVAWSPDGSALAVLATLIRQAMIMSMPSGRVITRIGDLASGTRSIDFDAQGNVILPGSKAAEAAFAVFQYQAGGLKNIRGPDVASQGYTTNHLLSFRLNAQRTILAGPHVFGSGADRQIRIAVYDARTWQLIADLDISATDAILSPDGSRLAAAAPGGWVEVFSIPDGARLFRFRANRNSIRTLAWSADGRRIATGTIARGFGFDEAAGKHGPLRDRRILKLWNASTGALIAASDEALGGKVRSLDFSPNNRWLASTSADGTCRLWDARTLSPRQLVARDPEHDTGIVKFSPVGNRLLLARTVSATAVVLELR